MNTSEHKGHSTRLYPTIRAARDNERCKPIGILCLVAAALAFTWLISPLQAQLTEQQTRELFTEANQLF